MFFNSHRLRDRQEGLDRLKHLFKEKNKILSLGGDLKNTFAIVPNNHVYISEYVGDLANFETYERFENTVKSYQKIFNFQPEIILKDLHPKYENQNIISKFSKILENLKNN